jgi:transposase-like protein
METVSNGTSGGHDVQVSAQTRRRRFTAEYKLRIVREADACSKPGDLGALLRREGLYSSHLVDWRRARDRGELVNAPKRGRKPKPIDPAAKRVAELERQNAKLLARAERAEALVELQKKVAALLGTPFPTEEP